MWVKSVLVIVPLALAGILAIAGARAETRTIALKNGESTELQLVYWISNCRSVMVGTPEIEVLEGPPEVTLALKEGKVIPRRQNCANEVPGGTLVLTAKDIEDPSYGALTIRVTFNTKDGERKRSRVYNISLLP